MSDPTPTRRSEVPALEPWAIELLEPRGTPDPQAREELARVVALLRSLPDPGEDPARVERLLRALGPQRRRPPVWRIGAGVARRLAAPPVALALAAGMAGLVALTVSPEGLSMLPGGPQPVAEPAPPTLVMAHPLAVAGPPAGSEPTPVRHRTTPLIRPQLVNVSVFSQSPAAEPRLRREPAPQAYDYAPAGLERHANPLEHAYVRALDRQLNQLMIDPDAFAQRLERVVQRDRFMARLAERAAERGDAPEIALRVRESQHPLAGQLVNQLLRATLVASVSPR